MRSPSDSTGSRYYILFGIPDLHITETFPRLRFGSGPFAIDELRKLISPAHRALAYSKQGMAVSRLAFNEGLDIGARPGLWVMTTRFKELNAELWTTYEGIARHLLALSAESQRIIGGKR